jgi:hypothetical protein
MPNVHKVGEQLPESYDNTPALVFEEELQGMLMDAEAVRCLFVFYAIKKHSHHRASTQSFKDAVEGAHKTAAAAQDPRQMDECLALAKQQLGETDEQYVRMAEHHALVTKIMDAEAAAALAERRRIDAEIAKSRAAAKAVNSKLLLASFDGGEVCYIVVDVAPFAVDANLVAINRQKPLVDRNLSHLRLKS